MGGGGQPTKIPDYRIYKVEGIPELEKVRDMLAKKGLKDPWLRNEAWRYAPEHYVRPIPAMIKSLGRGFKWGFAAFVLTVVAEKAYHKAYPDTRAGHH